MIRTVALLAIFGLALTSFAVEDNMQNESQVRSEELASSKVRLTDSNQDIINQIKNKYAKIGKKIFETISK